MSNNLDLISDETLRGIWKRHESDLKEISPEAFELLKSDSFSLSQFLLGEEYFKKRISTVFQQKGDALLDVGCGVGNWSLAAADNFNAVFGIDVHLNRVVTAQKLQKLTGDKNNVTFQGYSSGRFPFQENTFDGILAINMITFMDVSYEGFFQELSRVAKKGCKLYIIAHDSGFGMFLLWQALMNKSRSGLFTALKIWKHNLITKDDSDPLSWTKSERLIEIASKANWQLLHTGFEGDIMKNKQRRMWPKRYFGLPFMREYIFEAL